MRHSAIAGRSGKAAASIGSAKPYPARQPQRDVRRPAQRGVELGGIEQLLAAGVERAFLDLQRMHGGARDQRLGSREGDVWRQVERLQDHGELVVGGADGDRAETERRDQADGRALPGVGAHDERSRQDDVRAAVLERAAGDGVGIEVIGRAVLDVDHERRARARRQTERILQGHGAAGRDRDDLRGLPVPGRRRVATGAGRVRTHRPNRTVGGGHAQLGLQRGRLEGVEATDDHASDARIDHHLAQAQWWCEPRLPGAQVRAAEGRLRGIERREAGVGELQLQPETEVLRRRRRGRGVGREANVLFWRAERGAAGQPRRVDGPGTPSSWVTSGGRASGL